MLMVSSLFKKGLAPYIGFLVALPFFFDYFITYSPFFFPELPTYKAAVYLLTPIAILPTVACK